jgi:ribonuclease D
MSDLLLTPRGGLPPVIENPGQCREAFDQIVQGKGPIAIDAERASGYRYSQRAYLIQVKRDSGGLHLFDPISLEINGGVDWKGWSQQLSGEEWVIHASTQDLHCLRELGIHPKRLFDTELGARIAGCERVGLGALTEELLEITLEKEHSAVDWSKRPLHTEWLNYAALDVDVLLDLRYEVEDLLKEQRKWEWAQEEFEAIVSAEPAAPRDEPWRRTSGMHKVRDRLTMGVVKFLWEARDRYASQIDVAPGRVFNDATLIEVALTRPQTEKLFHQLLTKRTRYTDLPSADWFTAYSQLLNEPADLPELRRPSGTLPPIKVWKSKNPLAYAKVTHARATVAELSQELRIPAENLLSPEVLRRLCWSKAQSHSVTSEMVESFLHLHGARPWQIRLLTERLVTPLAATEPLSIPPEAEAEGSTQEE